MQRPLETHEAHYLDTVGDGLPDAVEHVYRRRFYIPAIHREVIEETHRIAHGIGIDGYPTSTSERKVLLVANG